MGKEDKEDKEDKKFEELLEHAWRYFELHANQRIMLFRFYVAFLGIFIIASGFLMLRFSFPGIAAEIGAFILSVALIFVTAVFWGLDSRNRTLIHLAEKAFREELEKHPQFKIDSKKEENLFYTKIFTAEKKTNSCITHTRCFSALFIGAIVAAVIYIFIATIYLVVC